MADTTNDTGSEIDEKPEKVYNPRFEKEGDPISGNVDIGRHDISKKGKKTLADFMSNVTLGKAGAAGKPNAFAVNGGSQDMKLTDPSTGLPAPHSNEQKNLGSSDQIKATGNTIGSFINTVDPQARSNFESLSRGDFNNAELTTGSGLATKEDKNSQKFGHTVMSDIKGVDSPSTRLGAPAIFAAEGSELQQNISAVLESNRFNSSPNTPFMQDNEANELGYTKQVELGRYVPNQDMVKFGDIRKVGHQMVVASTGHESNLDSRAIAELLPTVEQITGTQTLDSQSFRPNRMPAAGDITEDKGELVKGESDNASYGHLNSPIEPFASALPVGMFVNAVSGMATLMLSATALSALLDLIKPSGTGTSTLKPAEPYNLKKGRHAHKSDTTGGMLWEMLKTPKVEYSFMECMHLGILVFYGVTEIPGMGGIGGFDLEKLVKSARVVAGSPGYYNSINRAVLREAEVIAESVSSVGVGASAILDIFQIVETLTSSSTWRFFMTMAELGNQVRMGLEGHPRMDSGDPDDYKENAASRVKMSRASPSAAGAFYPGSQSPGRLAWRHSSSPSRYLLPSSFIRANIGAGLLGDIHLEEELAMSIDGDPYIRDVDGGTNSNLGAGKKFEGNGTTETPGRLSGEYVEYIENGLEAEYMPFYFHDLRTNEIISFHAFLGGYTDGFSTDYTSTSGYGRSDDVKIYNKTTRAISFDFTVAATSAKDLDVMYWNINKLVSMCYPQWSRGRQMTNGEDDRFIQPFSQIPTASPMIRVRIGDMLRSNYSKFGLQRIFGLGNPESEFNIDMTTDNASKHAEAKVKAKKDAAALAEKIFKSKEMFGLQFGDVGFASGGDGDLISSNQGGASPQPEPEYGYAVGDFVKLDPTPTKYWPRTSDGKMGKEQNPPIGPDRKEGRLHEYPNPVEVEIIKRVPGPKNNPSSFDSATAEASYDPKEVGIGELAYLVKIHTASPAHDSLGADIDGAYLHHRAEHSEITGLSEKGKKRIIDLLIADEMKKLGDPPPEIEGEERLRQFFDAEKNFIVRSFESSRGRGLAGFITGLNFDWAEATWEIDPGRRAPKMVKVSVSFAPVHDLHLGLDHNGMMTSVPFNVGLLANTIGRDPYDEFARPASDDYVGAVSRSQADGESRPGAKPEDPKVKSASKSASGTGTGLPFP